MKYLVQIFSHLKERVRPLLASSLLFARLQTCVSGLSSDHFADAEGELEPMSHERCWFRFASLSADAYAKSWQAGTDRSGKRSTVDPVPAHVFGMLSNDVVVAPL